MTAITTCSPTNVATKTMENVVMHFSPAPLGLVAVLACFNGLALEWGLDVLRLSSRYYSITLSARTNNASGTVTPIVLAVLTLITNSNLAGCWIGRSAGFDPLRNF